MRSLIPFLWHANPLELRLRVIAALVLLVIALIANVYVPILYKGAVDALTPRGQEMLVLPLALIFAYALEIGRAACRESVCHYVEIRVVAVSLKTKKQHQ